MTKAALNTIEVKMSCGQRWALWQDGVTNANLPAVVFSALQTFNIARINGRVVYTRTEG